jgi:diguanylate cyclase (GGDEF)-like protein
MQAMENVVWSVMLGGLLTIGTMAVWDVFVSRSAAAWRGLVFLTVTGCSCVLLSGLPEDVFPALPPVPVLVLKASLGPLSGAMVLMYLGQWLGIAAEDKWVHRTIVWGSAALVTTTIVITLLCLLFAKTLSYDLLLFAAAVNAVAVLMATLTSVRAAHLGDSMARTMTLGCLFMALSMTGLFSHQFNLEDDNLPIMVGTSFSTVVFFLVMVSLSIRHNREIRRLRHLSNLSQGIDPATKLPRGSVLLSKVDDAFWRSARLDTSCTVICLHLSNLYQLSDVAGHAVDQQILSAMASRVRRAVGFRCVVGLYHPRCFVVVISGINQPETVKKMTARLCEFMCEPLNVIGPNDALYVFTPSFSVGSVTVRAADAVPAQVIDQAEQQALASVREQHLWEDTTGSPLSA